jgi:hypothetical protein
MTLRCTVFSVRVCGNRIVEEQEKDRAHEVLLDEREYMDLMGSSDEFSCLAVYISVRRTMEPAQTEPTRFSYR